MRRPSKRSARASRACVPTYTVDPSSAVSTHHQGVEPSEGSSLSTRTIAPSSSFASMVPSSWILHVAAVPSMDVDITRSGRSVAGSGGITASARTAPVCAVGSSATLVVVSTPSCEEIWARRDLGTPRRRRRVERVRTSIARDEAGPVAEVVVRWDDAIRDIPLAPLAPFTSCPRQCRPTRPVRRIKVQLLRETEVPSGPRRWFKT